MVTHQKMSIYEKLVESGIKLPMVSPPVAHYVPVVVVDNIAHASAQLPIVNGRVAITGKLGENPDLAAGQEAARLCFINMLVHLSEYLPGGLDAITRIVRLRGFVSATPDFLDIAQIMDGASDLAIKLYGEAGRHARSTIGVSVLPLGAPITIEGIFKL